MGTVICALVILLVAFIILNASKLILKNSNKSIAWDHWMDLMVIGLSLSLSVILLRNTFAAIHLSPAIIIPLLVAIIIVARAKFKNTHLGMLSGTFFFLTAISISSLIYGIYQAKDPILSWTTQNKQNNDQVRFIKKPNVYFIITESYPNKEALEKIYNFDNGLFYKKLEELHFTLHHKYYSNYNHTLASLP